MIHIKRKTPSYDNQSNQLELKDNQFTSKKFHHIRKNTTSKQTLKSLESIGKCLNNVSINDIEITNLEKVCFILINDIDKDLGVGALNDGFLIGLNHRNHGYQVFYLYNSLYYEFVSYLRYFLQNTTKCLTVFYTGKNEDGKGIEFLDGILEKRSIEEIFKSDTMGQARVVFITDSINGGSVFTSKGSENAISFYVWKRSFEDSKKNKRSHGIFTYYLCKLMNDNPDITADEFKEKMNELLDRFNEEVICDIENSQLKKCKVFQNE